MGKLLFTIWVVVLLNAVGCVQPEIDRGRDFWSKVAGADNSNMRRASFENSRSLAGYYAVRAQVLQEDDDQIPQLKTVLSAKTPVAVVNDTKLTLRQILLNRTFAEMHSPAKPGYQRGPLPPELARHSFLKQFIKAISEQSQEREVAIELTRDGSLTLAKEILRMLAATEDHEKRPYTSIVRMYVTAWTHGKFVDRRGKCYDVPHDLSKTIDGETMGAIVTIAMEALADYMFEDPCCCQEIKGDDNNITRVYFNDTGKEPTAVTLTLQPALVLDSQSKPDHEGMTIEKAQLLSSISDLSGKKSSVVSNLILQMFKNVKIQFIVGGSFAVGDSTALQQMVNGLVETASRRLTEHYAYLGLYHFRYTEQQGSIQPAIDDDVNRTVAMLLQEQVWLRELLYP